MRIVPSLAALLVLSLSAAAQEEEGAKKSRDDDPKVVKARWCGECRTFLEARELVEKHRCPRCNRTARRVEVSKVRIYACAECGRRTECPRECCGAPVTESRARAAVVWRCESCDAFEPQEGSCPSPGCRKMGRTLVRSVELPRGDDREK